MAHRITPQDRRLPKLRVPTRQAQELGEVGPEKMNPCVRLCIATKPPQILIVTIPTSGPITTAAGQMGQPPSPHTHIHIHTCTHLHTHTYTHTHGRTRTRATPRRTTSGAWAALVRSWGLSRLPSVVESLGLDIAISPDLKIPSTCPGSIETAITALLIEAEVSHRPFTPHELGEPPPPKP